MKNLILAFCLSTPLLAAPQQLHIKLAKKPPSQSQSTQTKSTTKSSGTQTTSPATQSSAINLKSLMSPAQQKSTGVNQLSAQQLSSLETWLSHYVSSEKNQAQQATGDQLAVVLAEGRYIKLGNGQVWEISPNAWINTYYWAKGDPIEVGKSGDMLFPVLLTNQDTGQSVNAITPDKGVTQAFGQTQTIKKVENDGQFVTLTDGSTWDIDPSSRYMVQSWTPGTSVYVVKRPEQTTGAGYELYNGSTTRSVLANQTHPPTQNPDLLLKPSKQATTFPSNASTQATNQTSTFPSTTSNDGQNPSTQPKS